MLFSPVLAANGDALDVFQGGIDTTANSANLTTGPENQTPADALASMIGRVINFAFGTIAVIFITITMVGGYLWMAARGNEEQVTKAKKFILNGFFGLMVITLSYALVFVILQSVALSTGDVGVPTS